LSECSVDAVIYTDSKYGMDVLNTWSAGWEAKGWKKADGKPVLHTDIIIPMYELWKTIRSRARLTHVAAHTGATDPISQGNAMADSLATEATAATGKAATKNTIEE
jgi:ribonuclease HI